MEEIDNADLITQNDALFVIVEPNAGQPISSELQDSGRISIGESFTWLVMSMRIETRVCLF